MNPRNIGKHTSREIVSSFVAPHDGELLPLLLELEQCLSRNTLKQKLRDRCITVDGTPHTQYDTQVKKGQKIEIYTTGFAPKLTGALVQEVYADEALFIVYKMAGLPTVAVSKESERTLFKMVATHLKSYDSREKIFLLNRLDKDTAGYIVFARSRELQQQILDNWKDFMLENRFASVVRGGFDTSSGVLEATEQNKKSSKGETLSLSQKGASSKKKDRVTFRASYSVKPGSSPYLSGLEIELKTRNNAIRSQLMHIGHPILGDKRDREALIGNGSLALCAISMVIKHPTDGHILRFSTPIPTEYDKLLRMKLTRAQKSRLMQINNPSE